MANRKFLVLFSRTSSLKKLSNIYSRWNSQVWTWQPDFSKNTSPFTPFHLRNLGVEALEHTHLRFFFAAIQQQHMCHFFREKLPTAGWGWFNSSSPEKWRNPGLSWIYIKPYGIGLMSENPLLCENNGSLDSKLKLLNQVSFVHFGLFNWNLGMVLEIEKWIPSILSQRWGRGSGLRASF